MPVEDHAIHPSTQKGPDFRYGCWNRKPFADAYIAPQRREKHLGPDAWQFKNFTCANEDFTIGTTYILHQMSRECRYDMSLTDPNCQGCEHIGSGERYAASVKENGK